MRARELTLSLAFLISLLAGSPPANAQLGYLWSYDELLQESDVVVIGAWQSSTDTGHHGPHPELGYPVVEMRTAFEIEAILKNEGQSLAVGGSLRLKHYRRDWERIKNGLVNGGSVLVFEQDRHYILFLAPAMDGLYEPRSGHTFPADSVLRLDQVPSD